MMEGRVDRAEPDDQNTERSRHGEEVFKRLEVLCTAVRWSACGCGWSVHLQQQNPDYDPWEEPCENSSSPVDLTLAQDKTEDDLDQPAADAAKDAA